jgi:hypothetical protein
VSERPTPKRIREARAVGLRPRSRALTLAGLAAAASMLLGFAPRARVALATGLEIAFAGPPEIARLERSVHAGSCALLLGVLLTVGVLAAARFGPRHRARRAFGVSPELEILPPAAAMLACGLALILAIAAGLPSLAGAARAVDAEPELLATVWLVWVRRALLSLAMIAAGIGLLERRIAARRLWQGLHQTPTQARPRSNHRAA